MDEVRNFEYPASATIHAEVRDTSDDLVDPTSIVITITHIGGTVVTNAVAMTKDDVGLYSYTYRPASYLPGYYNAKATITDGSGGTAFISIKYGGFNIL